MQDQGVPGGKPFSKWQQNCELWGSHGLYAQGHGIAATQFVWSCIAHVDDQETSTCKDNVGGSSSHPCRLAVLQVPWQCSSPAVLTQTCLCLQELHQVRSECLHSKEHSLQLEAGSRQLDFDLRQAQAQTQQDSLDAAKALRAAQESGDGLRAVRVGNAAVLEDAGLEAVEETARERM